LLELGTVLISKPHFITMLPQAGRRSIGQMPYRRRHQGMCALERMAERGTWQTILNMLVVLFAVIQQHNFNRVAVQNGLIAIVDMIQQVELARQFVWDPNDPIDGANCNRGIDSFSEEEDFRKEDLAILFQLLMIPLELELKGGRNI
jgi:hypothetical protein